MANTRLEIGSNENVGYFTDIPVNVIFQISDVQRPDKRKGSYSKTITLPGNQSNNILFENIFEANISLQTFNPHLKTTAKYYVDELTMFRGHAQLLKVNVDETTKKVTYEIVLLGEILTLFTDIAQRYLTDLDFSAYDHDLSYAQISGSWGSSGSGFVYPMIDWGTNNSNLSVMKPTDFRACLFVREYWDKIFTDAGYTWTSNFLDGSIFSKLIIPSTTAPALTQSDLDDNRFLAVANGSETHTVTANPILTAGPPHTVQVGDGTLFNVNFQSETYDQGANFATPTFTVPVTAKYNVTAKLGLNFVVTRNAVDVSANITGLVSGLHVIVYNTTTSSVAGLYDYDIANASFAASNSNNVAVSLNGIQLTATHQYKIVIRYQAIKFQYTATPVGATWAFESTILSGSNFAIELASKAVYEGATVPGNSLVPVGIKQTDFLASVIRMFNLYVMVDPDNSTNYIIEPRNGTSSNFYSTTNIVDWTQKHDDNSITEVIPLGELDAKDYRFTYKNDGDYYNKLHTDSRKNLDGSPQVYGTHEESITNDFLKNLNITDVIFAPTPYTINTTSDIVAPAILKKENNIVSESPSAIRILYYGGSISVTGLSWNFVYNNGANTVTYNTFPAAGHTDNPYAPTIDINWGLPTKLYYTYPNLYWTTNNLVNTYYSVYLNQISDKNSKVVITDFFLTPIDIKNFDFRKPVFWKDAYYIVEKLDFNPLARVVTRVTLLKLTHFDAFVPSTYYTGGGLGNENTSWEKTKSENIVKGPNNFSESENSSITASEDCFITSSSSNVQLINCNNVQVIGAENFIGIGLSDVVIDSTYSNTTWNGNDVSVSVSSDTDIDMSYHKKTLVIDASIADVTLTVDIDNCDGLEFSVIVSSIGANQIYLDSTTTIGTENYIGNSMPYDLVALQYDTYKFKVIGDTIYNLE